MTRLVPGAAIALSAVVLATACGGGGGSAAGSGGGTESLPQLTPAQGATRQSCSTLTRFSFLNTRITTANVVAAGTLSNADAPVGEHCLVTGRMGERTGFVDGQAYAIGFEMRLPLDWSGRFLLQGNGGIDGFVVDADGGLPIGSGGLLRNGLQQGFAILSTDAGHNSAQNPLFGRDAQARLDLGYQAVAVLTPMAKALIRAAYGKGPDRSYVAGAGNGGRHAMVAAARYAADYDGFVAASPGFNLPKAAVANLWSAQQFDRVATTPAPGGQPDNESALPLTERQLIASAILARCDALDGAADGLVQDVEACRTAFDLARDVPTCSGARDGTCLSAAQKSVVAAVFAGPRTAAGTAVYSRFPFDPGIVQTGWADGKLRHNLRADGDPAAVGFIFTSPPMATPAMAGNDALSAAFARAFSIETDAPKIFATSGNYTESSMSFMAPPNPTRLDTLRERGAKMLVFHGTADSLFSVDDTASWYDALDASYGGRAASFVRFFRVPGMGHARGGPSTDQFDALAAIVAWVEQGQAPDAILASARGIGHAGGANPDVPSGWSANRTRPLCPYPQVARYVSGSIESASSFACAR